MCRWDNVRAISKVKTLRPKRKGYHLAHDSFRIDFHERKVLYVNLNFTDFSHGSHNMIGKMLSIFFGQQ